ncbi:HK97 family phage prohead protease [Microbacterium sp.]|uniref:phage major capsid protein n=1 Tax=Actinomycetes TaxID=1760 RepID=UPI0037C8FF0D
MTTIDQPTRIDPTTGDQTRVFECRAEASTEKREIRGVGVPLDTETTLYPGLREVFDQECAFDGIERAKLLIEHDYRDLAGVITDHARNTGRFEITAKASRVEAGERALVLAADGALDSFSIGFRPVEYTETRGDDGSITIRHTRVQVREFSLTARPYYPTATVNEVRNDHRQKEGTMPDTATDAAGLDEVRARLDSMEDQQRTLTAILERVTDETPAAAADTRSVGEFVRDLAAGDQDTIAAYNRAMEHQFDDAQHRAYTGGTTADAPVKDGWVGDLTRIFDSSSGVLARVFSTGTLPEKGMNIEYAELASNTVQVTEQEAEGDDLDFGKVTLTTKTAPVKTYGGYTQLSRQAIQRSTLPLLNRSLEALAIAAGARKKAVLRAAFGALVTARTAIADNGGVVLLGATLAAGVAGNWEDALIDAALKYDAEDAQIDAMIVSATVFKKMRSLTVSGERVFTVFDDNHSGHLNLPGLTGNLASVPVYLDAGQAGDSAVFANGRAIRQYDSALVSLQDENIINLSKDFSVYRYGAVAAEIPQLVVPVKLAAS